MHVFFYDLYLKNIIRGKKSRNRFKGLLNKSVKSIKTLYLLLITNELIYSLTSFDGTIHIKQQFNFKHKKPIVSNFTGRYSFILNYNNNFN